MFGFGNRESAGRIATQFSIPITRKVATGGTLQFVAQISGYFLGRGSKVAFVVSSIAAERIPHMDLSSFSPSEISEIERHAITVEYKKLIGKH